jgi:hypothetical protein
MFVISRPFTTLLTDTNGLPGSIPSEIGLMTKLEYLHLGKWLDYKRRLLRRLPVSVWSLAETNLDASPFSKSPFRTLFPAACSLDGLIPTEIGLLQSCKQLSLGKLLSHFLSRVSTVPVSSLLSLVSCRN